jgi:hypothetical protein
VDFGGLKKCDGASQPPCGDEASPLRMPGYFGIRVKLKFISTFLLPITSQFTDTSLLAGQADIEQKKSVCLSNKNSRVAIFGSWCRRLLILASASC